MPIWTYTMRFQKFGHKILHNLRLWHFLAENVLFFRLEVLIAHVFVRLDRALQEHVLLKPRAWQKHVLLKPRNVRLSVCLFVPVCSLLRYRLNVFLPPLPKVGCPIFLEIRNPWGKVMERSGLRLEHFVWKWSKIAAQKKFFFGWFCLAKHGGNHTSQWIRDC